MIRAGDVVDDVFEPFRIGSLRKFFQKIPYIPYLLIFVTCECLNPGFRRIFPCMIDSLGYIPESETIDSETRMRNDAHEKLSIFLTITSFESIEKFQDIEDEDDDLIVEDGFVLRKADTDIFLEQSFCDEFECFIFLCDNSDLIGVDSSGNFRCDIVYDPGDFLEFVLESPFSDSAARLAYGFEFLHRPFEDISYIVHF